VIRGGEYNSGGVVETTVFAALPQNARKSAQGPYTIVRTATLDVPNSYRARSYTALNTRCDREDLL
jgi:hypothetical protein